MNNEVPNTEKKSIDRYSMVMGKNHNPRFYVEGTYDDEWVDEAMIVDHELLRKVAELATIISISGMSLLCATLDGTTLRIVINLDCPHDQWVVRMERINAYSVHDLWLELQSEWLKYLTNAAYNSDLPNVKYLR